MRSKLTVILTAVVLVLLATSCQQILESPVTSENAGGLVGEWCNPGSQILISIERVGADLKVTSAFDRREGVKFAVASRWEDNTLRFDMAVYGGCIAHYTVESFNSDRITCGVTFSHINPGNSTRLPEPGQIAFTRFLYLPSQKNLWVK